MPSPQTRDMSRETPRESCSGSGYTKLSRETPRDAGYVEMDRVMASPTHREGSEEMTDHVPPLQHPIVVDLPCEYVFIFPEMTAEDASNEHVKEKAEVARMTGWSSNATSSSWRRVGQSQGFGLQSGDSSRGVDVLLSSPGRPATRVPSRDSYPQKFLKYFSKSGPIWAEDVPEPVVQAKKIFYPACEGVESIFKTGYEDTMETVFGDCHTTIQYHDQVRQLFAEILVSNRCGFELRRQVSVDEDEVLLMIRLPVGHEHDHGSAARRRAQSEPSPIPSARSAPSDVSKSPQCSPRDGKLRRRKERVATHRFSWREDGTCIPVDQQIAKEMQIRVPLKAERYQTSGLRKCSEDVHGRQVPAYHQYLPDKEDWFQPFSQIQRIRMVRRHINIFVDLAEMRRQKILIKDYATHDWTAVKKFQTSLANLSRWWEPLFWSFDLSDDTRDYFGEDVAFFFCWAVHLTRALISPAFFCLIFFFVGNGRGKFKWLAPISAGLLACFAPLVNEQWKRTSHRNVQRWGMKGYHRVAVQLPEYNQADDGTWKVEKWKYMSYLFTAGFFCLIVTTVTLQQAYKAYLLDNMDTAWPTQFVLAKGLTKEKTYKLVMAVGNLFITIQILVYDFVWGEAAEALTRRRNCKTTELFQSELIYILVPVKLFNNTFTFLNIAFLKPVRQHCIPDYDACVTELREAVLFFFVSRSLFTLFTLWKNRRRVRTELQEELAKADQFGNQMTYIQVQAKLDVNKSLTEDYMEFLVSYALVCCFSSVFPELAMLALLTNLIELRLLFYRNLYSMQRPYPAGAEDMGSWWDFIEFVGRMVVMVNCGLACFILEPLRSEFTFCQQLLTFVFAEHIILFLKAGIEVVIDDVPHDVQKIEDDNHSIVNVMLGHIRDGGDGDGTLEVEVPNQQLASCPPMQVDFTLRKRQKSPLEESGPRSPCGAARAMEVVPGSTRSIDDAGRAEPLEP